MSHPPFETFSSLNLSTLSAWVYSFTQNFITQGLTWPTSYLKFPTWTAMGITKLICTNPNPGAFLNLFRSVLSFFETASHFTSGFSHLRRNSRFPVGFSSAANPPSVSSTCTTLFPAATVALRHMRLLVGTSLSSWASLRSISAGNTSLWSCFSTTPRRTVFSKKHKALRVS